MKNAIVIYIMGVLLLSGLNAIAMTQDDQLHAEETIMLPLSGATIKDNGDYVTVLLPESESQLMESGKPILPILTQTSTFPLGTKIHNIKIEYETTEYHLSKKIQPSPKPVALVDPLIQEETIVEILDQSVYSSSDLYPSEPYIITQGVGMVNGENVLIINVKINSQYSPEQNLVYIPSQDVSITIEHTPPSTPYHTFIDEYDLLIVTPDAFTAKLQPLVDHKNSIGVKTLVKTTEDIYAQYTAGRDDPEKIKLCIYDMKETYNIKYVLLAGGRQGQTFKWYVPERVPHNDDGWEAGYSSDLYYADIYKYADDQPVFEDWDTNQNGIIGEYRFTSGGDRPDYYPDVSIGRLPFRTSSEIERVVNKIIAYETSADDSWFKKGIVISGDTFPPQRGGDYGWYEGEMETAVTADLLESIGFTVERLWLSLDAWAGVDDVISAISKGAGFVHFAGHGNPAAWGNHPADDAKKDDKHYVDGLTIFDMNNLDNGNQLPIIVVGGCHNAQFNVTMSNIFKGILRYGIMGYFFRSPMRFYYMEWVPSDFCTTLVFEKNGGAIASIGCTGLGYGYVNEHALAGLGGWIEPRFFDAYANQSKSTVGEAHDQAIIDYINIIGRVHSDQIDRKTIEEWTLIGDPSLQIGGI